MGRPSWEPEVEGTSASEGGAVVAENEQTAHRECQTSDRQTSDQRCKPVERRRAAPVYPDDDRRDGTARRVDRVRDETAIGPAADDRRDDTARRVDRVRHETAIGPTGRAVRCRAGASADESDEHAENEWNPEHVKLLRFGPLGAADQHTVACSRRNEGNVGCKPAARALEDSKNPGGVVTNTRE